MTTSLPQRLDRSTLDSPLPHQHKLLPFGFGDPDAKVFSHPFLSQAGRWTVVESYMHRATDSTSDRHSFDTYDLAVEFYRRKTGMTPPEQDTAPKRYTRPEYDEDRWVVVQVDSDGDTIQVFEFKYLKHAQELFESGIAHED
jgi:hypothetical protein